MKKNTEGHSCRYLCFGFHITKCNGRYYQDKVVISPLLSQKRGEKECYESGADYSISMDRLKSQPFSMCAIQFSLPIILSSDF